MLPAQRRASLRTSCADVGCRRIGCTWRQAHLERTAALPLFPAELHGAQQAGSRVEGFFAWRTHAAGAGAPSMWAPGRTAAQSGESARRPRSSGLIPLQEIFAECDER